jgi:histone H1/5
LFSVGFTVIFSEALCVTITLEIDEMATTTKRKSAKKSTATSTKKVAAAKKSATKKAPAKKVETGNFFRNVLNEARDQMDDFFDSAKLKAKEIAAKEKVMQKKAELATKAEIDKARHLADQAEKWMKARVKSDTKKINALEKKLARQLRNTERKLSAQAKATEKRAKKEGKALKKKLEESADKAFGKAPAKRKAPASKRKAAPAKKKAVAPKRKVAAAKTKSRAKK